MPADTGVASSSPPVTRDGDELIKPNLNDPEVRRRVAAFAAALQRWVWDAELGSPTGCAEAAEHAARALGELVGECDQGSTHPDTAQPAAALRHALRAAEEWV